jgi:hypothetical protein
MPMPEFDQMACHVDTSLDVVGESYVIFQFSDIAHDIVTVTENHKRDANSFRGVLFAFASEGAVALA